MDSNSKRNEHPRCGCAMCSRGLRSEVGHAQQRAVNRRIRHETKRALRTKDLEEVDPIVESTGYTD